MPNIFVPIANPKPAADRLKIRARSINIINNLMTPKQVVVQVETFPYAGTDTPLDLPTQVIGQFSFDPIAEAAKDPRIGQALVLIETVITERLIAWKAAQDTQVAANGNLPKGYNQDIQ